MDNTQKVRHIPIFVEGRDQPIINKGHDSQNAGAQPTANEAPQNHSSNTSAFASAESSTGQPHHGFDEFDGFGRQPMGFGSDMGFGQDIPMPSGSIFDRAKDFPVRDFFNMRSGSPRRSESPLNHHHHQSTYQQHPHQSRGSPGPQQPRPQPTPPQGNQDRSVPVQFDGMRATTPQRQMPPLQQQQAPPPAPDSVPAKQKAIEDSITKIQKIQASVLDLMSRVEQYDGSNPREYAFLDEMLTQDLLKLDDIDAEGKENIKSARREAIKCINSLISLLEAKKDEAERAGVQKSESKDHNEASRASMEKDRPTQNGLNGGSKNSSYDNVSKVQQTSSNNSVNKAELTKIQEPVTAEDSLEAKVQEELNKQEQQQQAK